MLHKTISNDDFLHNVTELQHSCDIVSNSYNTVPTLQGCVALKIVISNNFIVLCNITLKVKKILRFTMVLGLIKLQTAVREISPGSYTEWQKSSLLL